MALGLMLVLTLLAGIVVNPHFMSPRNLANVLEQAAGLGFASIGQTLAVLTGGIDLSIGAIISASTIFLASGIDGNDAMVWPMVAATLALGASIGAANGLLVVRLRVHPLIVTLGMAAVVEGCVLLHTLKPTGSTPIWFEAFAWSRLWGMPVAGLVMALIFVLVAAILAHTGLGRSIYAVGDNRAAARMRGIPAGRMLVVVYAASGFFAALAGVYFVSRTGVGDPRIGVPFTLASITPVILGGTILAGGKGGVIGTLFGVLLISLIGNVLNHMNVATSMQWVVQGLIILAAVSFHGRGRPT
ncbi:MAG: ABC transporter permease [Thiotrichales bacterium]|nr:ABC transporter permease [Thiotrichales bacterium]